MCFAGIEDDIAVLVQKRQLAERAAAGRKLQSPEPQRRIEPKPVTQPIALLQSSVPSVPGLVALP